MSRQGLYCVFEGLDGSGKSTLVRALEEALPRSALAGVFSGVKLLREPTHGPVGRKIRANLHEGLDLPREEWLELFLQDRAENAKTNIRPSLAEGAVLLQDRYYYSTAAYQGDPRNPPTSEDIVRLHREKKFPEPDILFYLDLDAESALERLKKERKTLESFEKIEQLRRIATNYENILPPGTVRLDANEKPEALRAEALAVLERHVGGRK